MRRYGIFLTLAILAISQHAWSQKFENSGSVTAGYRFTDISGYRPNYDQLFGLRSGLRLQEFNLSGHSDTETYALSADGIGGEPFSGGAFRLKKTNAYDLRADYRQSYFYWNSNDEGLQPTGLHGLTAWHDWSTVRKWGGVQMDIRASDRLRLNFEFNRQTRSGMTFTTRNLDYFGSSATWAAFARANPYFLAAPVDETAQRFAAGLSYKFRGWNLFYHAGYQSYLENIALNNVTSPQRSINIDDPATAGQLVNQASWSGFRRLRTPVSEFVYNGRPSRRLQLRGGYIYYRYKGPATLASSFTGTATGPYTVSETDTVRVREPNHVLDQGLSYEFKDWWTLHADYRYSRFTIDSRGSFASASNLTGTTQGSTTQRWRYGLHIADIAFEFLPLPHVVVRPGIRLMKRDVRVVSDGVVNSNTSIGSKIVSPIGSIAYTPSERVSVRADFQTFTNSTPYTRITPKTNIASRFVGRYQLTESLSIENALNIRNGRYEATDFRNSYRSNGTVISYRFSDRFSTFGGFTYDSFLATASVAFLRGTAPLNTVWRDQTVNRVWQAGVEARPRNNFDVRLNGNFLQTTGVGEISGELPVYGPIRWPIVTGTIGYRFPRIGRLSAELMRTYFIQDIFTADNFSGNVLELRWTKEF